nr:retrovirus-related Pol polyprotein from transposon TNT 1-94 [Tanacetum cinerariifolium]
MEPYYLKCIKDDTFQVKAADGDAKPESQWTPNERRVVVQDQRLKSIIMSCLPDDIMESVISCVSAKETWTDLVHSFEGPLDTKENRIMDLKLEYQTFRAKSTESLSQTYTRYKTLLNELANDGLRNANHNQTLDLVDIYERFFYEDNLIHKKYSDTKKALITTPSSTSSSNSNSQADPKFQKDYKAEYKKMKAKLALLEASPSSSQNPKTFQPKNKGLVAKTFIGMRKRFLMRKKSLRDELLILKQAKLDAVTFQIQNIELTKLNHALQEQLKEEKKINEKFLPPSKIVSQCISKQIPHQKKKILGGELFTESSSKMNENENLFVLASIGLDDCKNYPECEIYGSYDHFTSRHNRVIHIRGGMLAESSRSSESSIGVKCNTCGSIVHSTTDHNELDYFKRETHQGAHLVPGQWMLKEYDWCQELSVQIYRAARKCLHLLHMDFFGPVSPVSINHVKYTIVIVDGYSRYTWVHFLMKKSQAPEIIMSFIRMNLSSPYKPEQNGVAERKNRTLIEAARTMLNGHDKTPYEIFRERIPDISYFHVFGCTVFIHNHKDHLGKFDAKVEDGYLLGYSFVSKAFRVFNTRRQQIEETYHVTFDESMEAIRFTHTSDDDVGIDDSSRYPHDEFFHQDDPFRQYQIDSDISYYVIPHGH